MNNSSVNESASPVVMIDALNYIDLTIRCLTTAIFLAYFALVACFKEQRKASLVYVHHANFVNMIYTLIFLCFFNSTYPNLGSENVNNAFCQLVEILFGLLKFLRSYSVLLIALYRLAAVYAIDFYRHVNKSSWKIPVSVAILWLLSITLALSTKYATRTTYHKSLCLDGYSNEMASIIAYMVVTSLVGILLPSSLALVIYYMVRHKLNKTENRAADSMTKRGQRLNTQLLAFNVSSTISFSIAFVQTFRYIIPEFNTTMYFVRQLLRIINLASIATFPVISLYFNPVWRIWTLRSGRLKEGNKTRTTASKHF